MSAGIALPRAANPRVSILIPAFGAERLARCLQSLAEALNERVPAEVVAVLNGSGTALRDVAASADGLRIVDPPVNLGFPAGCNLARSAARGEYLVIVQDDGVMSPGWLETLVGVADAHPEAGLVGSVTLWPGGERIIQAGWAMFSDGSFHPIAAGQSPSTLDGREPYAVDTLSSHGMLVRARTWDAVGGLEEDYFPLYMSDATISRQVWGRGEAVLCAPRARAEHAASSSTKPRFRAFVFNRNYATWHERWATEIATYEPPGEPEQTAIRRALERVDALWRAARPGPGPIGASRAAYDLNGDAQQRLEAGIRFAARAVEVREAFADALEGDLDRSELALTRSNEECSRLADELAVARAQMDAQLAAHRAYEAKTAAELAHLLERAETLDAILAGGWWRLRERLLPLLRLVHRRSG